MPDGFRQHDFSVSAALDAGISRGRLRGADLRRTFHGARSTVPLPPAESEPSRAAALRRLREYRPLLREGQFFSDVSAAVLWGLPLPWHLYAEPPHVATTWPARAPRVGGTIGHAYQQPRTLRRGDWVLQSPADAWCGLAPHLTVDELVAAGDALFWRQRKLTTRARLGAAIRRFGGRRGAVKLRAAFALIRENAESAKETEWRLAIMRAGFPEPEINYPLYDSDGKLIAVFDLAYPLWVTGIDYEGQHHAANAEQFAHDIRRYNAIRRAGWADIRIAARSTRAEILDDLEAELRRHGWRPDAPSVALIDSSLSARRAPAPSRFRRIGTMPSADSSDLARPPARKREK
ncbi:hypothetical protein [Gryllotalpicola ginsengisoli]|uniref:hypothetical protein n=1 Tax=Gryllotalpicola ginsengisoli TaxID=444608 RepID=UPI0012DC3A0D|nr:hypothetical protein [Gryllotalpicola ginsengisoli]